MKLLVERHGLRIVPQTEVEEAWVEEVLGLRKDGDSVALKRVNAWKSNAMIYLEVEEPEDPQ